MLYLISNTTNAKGLKVSCRVDMNQYAKGIKISDKRMTSLNIEHQKFHGEWNYTIYPKFNYVISS